MGLLRRIKRYVLSLAQRAVIAILRAGPVPAHIAFVMDGNRRYATSRGLAATAGHGHGYTALERVLEICARLEIRCVSVYAFSIDNFKRGPGEVDTLMGLAEGKLVELARHGELFEKYGIRLNVCGKKEMLPVKVQEAVRWAEERTKAHERAILNLCMPYSSRDEMTTAVEKAVQSTLDQGLGPETITPDTIAAHLMTSPTVSGSPPLDILVRTSGVSRLSDFMLWQSHKDVQLQFSSVYWPDFGLKELVPILLDFQRRVWSNPTMHQKERRRRMRLLDDEAEGMIRDYKRKLA